MKPLILILNGPPNSGKDTLADLLEEELPNTYKFQFKEQLYRDTAAYFDIPVEHFKRMATDRNLKEKYSPALKRTPREALIMVSEKIVKPFLGKDIYGRHAADAIKDYGAEVAVFSDGGFEDELPPLYDVGEVVIVRLERDGCSFEGDSRDYLPNPTTILKNNGTLAEAIHILRGIINVYTTSK